VISARDRLAAILAEVKAPGSFSARRTAPVDDLHIEVRGVGPLVFPVADRQARALCRFGRPARYGRGEQTLLDAGVRDTWEIPKSRVKVDKRRWAKTLQPVLGRLRRDLGLPSTCELKAELHSMLVYAPGQFFVPHQDSEKDDAMLGSLVVTLPSSFTGGALVIEHGGESATYRSSKNISFVAFYADCRHQVRPVRTGHRIVLTYNLLLQGEAVGGAGGEAGSELVDAAARCLDEHFSTPESRPGRPVRSEPDDPPDRLVYLLDHEYTARGLSWSRLKGSDAGRASVLAVAANGAACDVVLALADVHETWSCFEPDWTGRWRAGRRYGRWGDDGGTDDDWDSPDDAAGHEDYELDELIDRGTTLDCWIDPSGGPAEPVATSVADTEVCASTPSTDLRPYASEYEGYMGNYGNTMDRWYWRGALVVWPHRRNFVVRAQASPAWALDRLRDGVRSGDLADARERAASLAPFWAAVAIQAPTRDLLGKAMRVAGGLGEPVLAAMLLKPFRVEMLGRGDARALVELVDGYGEPWARDLLLVWFGDGRPWAPQSGQNRPDWMASLPQLCEVLQAAGHTGTAAARLLVQSSWSWLRQALGQRREIPRPSRRDEALTGLAKPIGAVLEASAVIGSADLRDAAIGFLGVDGEDLLSCLMPVLRGAKGLTWATRTAAGLDALAEQTAALLTERLARPPRSSEDWSIEVPTGCGCDLCGTLGRFLAAPATRTLEWPLRQDGRKHVHGTIDGAELPVHHQTRRTGRPYTLVLTKTDDVFDRERLARSRDEADLAWLSGHWDVDIVQARR